MLSEQQLDATFFALADPTRRAILGRLAKGETTVMDLAKPFSMSQPAISRHLKVLERAGLIERRREAQRRPCRLDPQALAAAKGWIERCREVWDMNYRRLDGLLVEMGEAERKADAADESRSPPSDPNASRTDQE